jgi:hypothetical protein
MSGMFALSLAHFSDHKPIALCHGDLKQRQFCAAVGVPQHVGCGEGFVGEGKSRLIEYAPFQDDPAKVAYLVSRERAKDTRTHTLIQTVAYVLSRTDDSVLPNHDDDHFALQLLVYTAFCVLCDGFVCVLCTHSTLALAALALLIIVIVRLSAAATGSPARPSLRRRCCSTTSRRWTWSTRHFTQSTRCVFSNVG